METHLARTTSAGFAMMSRPGYTSLRRVAAPGCLINRYVPSWSGSDILELYGQSSRYAENWALSLWPASWTGEGPHLPGELS